MAIDEFQIPSHVTKYLKDEGYTLNTSMTTFITQWWSWYTSDTEHDSDAKKFYSVKYSSGGKKKSRKRLSLKPARRACREWASLLLNEDTDVACATDKANEWLNDYLERTAFWINGQEMVETAFALGTGAWALWFDFDEAVPEIKLRTYDARMVVPLSWDMDGVSECAFVTKVSIKGKTADQLQIHRISEETGSYVIDTALFIDGNKVNPEAYDVLAEFDTGCKTPTFGIVRPGIRNVCADMSPYGQSVFHDGLDSIKAVEIAWDAIFQEVDLTGVMVFMDEALIDVRDENGRAIPVSGDDHKFRKVAGHGASDFYEVYSPDIRIEPLVKALDTALAEYGDQMGFGQDYFTLDKAGGLKTATEVSSDNSQMMRSVKKHENALGGAVSQVLTALLTCAKLHCGADIEDNFGSVSVTFDDSIIEDTAAKKSMMLAEISAGVVPAWMYLVEFYGMTEDEARAEAAAGQVEEPVAFGF